MTYFDSLDFVYHLVFERFDLPIWIWSSLTFALSLILIHWLWGRLWNAHWGLFTRPPIAITSFVLALIVAVSALIWLAADRSGSWLDQQRTELSRRFADSGKRNRSILIKARKLIGPGPNENTLTMRSARDLLALAETAASSVDCPLTPTGPLGRGAPCHVRDAASVAQAVVNANPPPSLPLDVSPENPWTKAAVISQIEEALSYATPLLHKGMTELQSLMAVLFWSALGLQVLVVPIAAVADIRVHPSV